MGSSDTGTIGQGLKSTGTPREMVWSSVYWKRAEWRKKACRAVYVFANYYVVVEPSKVTLVVARS